MVLIEDTAIIDALRASNVSNRWDTASETEGNFDAADQLPVLIPGGGLDLISSRRRNKGQVCGSTLHHGPRVDWTLVLLAIQPGLALNLKPAPPDLGFGFTIGDGLGCIQVALHGHSPRHTP